MPVAAGRSGVIVSSMDVPDVPLEVHEPEEPEVPLFPGPLVPEPPAGGAGPMALTMPGVVAPVGSTMDTASPVVTAGRSGPSATLTVRLAAVTSKGACPGAAS